VPILINILAIFIWFLHWHGYWKALNLKAFSLSFMALSLFLWLKIKGVEFGSIYFFISTSIIGLLFLVESKHSFKDWVKFKQRHATYNQAKNLRLEKEVTNKILEYIPSRISPLKQARFLLKSFINLLLMILVPFFSAASISLLISTAFSIQGANSLIISLSVFIAAWSLLLTWIYMKSQRKIALCLLSLMSIITLSSIYTTASYVASSPIVNSSSIHSL